MTKEEIAKEIRETWRQASSGCGQLESYRLIERMVDRLGYGRTNNNPSLVVIDENTHAKRF